MDTILIQGGKPLYGKIKISGAKNASLPIMAASLLTNEEVKLTNIPKLSDIKTMITLLENHGASIDKIDTDNSFTLNINSDSINNHIAPYEIVRKMRASIWVLGALIGRFGNAKVSMPGGCAIGARQIDMHISVMEAMGAEITLSDGYINATCPNGLKGIDFTFSFPSVGATINAILATSLAKGDTILSNSAKEPEIADLCHCLNKMGAEIYGIGTDKLTIIGKKSLHGTEYKIMPDRIEAGTYMIAGVATKGEIEVDINHKILTSLIDRMQLAGVDISYTDQSIKAKYVKPIKAVDISTKPYPHFATDLQAQFLSLMTLANGTSTISENIFENRFMHVPELCRMGAKISIDHNKAIVQGVEKLKNATIMASDLRASVSLIIAALCADGESKIKRIYHLDRGYQELEKKLSKCGADILRINENLI